MSENAPGALVYLHDFSNILLFFLNYCNLTPLLVFLYSNDLIVLVNSLIPPLLLITPSLNWHTSSENHVVYIMKQSFRTIEPHCWVYFLVLIFESVSTRYTASYYILPILYCHLLPYLISTLMFILHSFAWLRFELGEK